MQIPKVAYMSNVSLHLEKRPLPIIVAPTSRFSDSERLVGATIRGEIA